MSALRQIRRRRMMVMALALAWLPYVVVRCIAAPGPAHAECGMLEHGGETAEHGVSEHHEHGEHEHEGPVRTCCELTGKSNITLAAPLSVYPPILFAIAVSPSGAASRASEVFGTSARLQHAHAPPAYLRNSALRI